MITQYVLRSKSLTPLLLMILCTCCVLTTSVHAQAVHIPDPNLRAAIADALGIPHGSPITQEDMNSLTDLDVLGQGIVDLSGLEHATNLTRLIIPENPIVNLSPLANLRALTYLEIDFCNVSDLTPLSHLIGLTTLNALYNRIVDIRPLANLTQLVTLRLSDNRIVDVHPLANLTQLVTLRLSNNHIVDVYPLAGLVNLTSLEIENNQIADHSPLHALALTEFSYDQTCEMPPLPLEPRLANRTYPSIFSPWAAHTIANRPELSFAEQKAYHDLRWNTTRSELHFLKTDDGFNMVGHLPKAIRKRDEIQSLNPNSIHLIDVGIRAAPIDWFPDDWAYWIRDEQGNIFREFSHEGVLGGHGLMDFTHPHIQDMIVQQAIAVSNCGLYDGIFFDYWSEDRVVLGGWDGTQVRLFRTLEEELHAREIIVRRIRANTRPNFLIIGNTNDRIIPKTALYVNGSFMETLIPYSRTGIVIEDAITRVERSLLWLDQHLREPRVNCLESYAIPTEAPDSPNNVRWMRAFTTLSLTHSDGFVLFEATEIPGHYWYDFWDADLGRPVGEKGQLYQDIDGLYIREFTNGWAVYNHSGAEQTVTLPELASGVASGVESTTHTLPNLDGEMYLRVKPVNPADVNGDGVVNIFDLTLVAQAIGTDGAGGDVNGDGVVNVFDLVFVANQF